MTSTEINLTDLASEIRSHHLAAVTAAVDAVGHAREAGRLLIQAKDQLPHGAWLPWLAENFDMSPRTAQQYMRLSSIDPLNAKRVSHLPLRRAIKELATPRTATPVKTSLLRTKPLLSEPADVIRDLGRRWHDVKMSLCLLLFADGSTADEIAVLTGFDVREVGSILNPRPPIRFADPQDLDMLSRSVSLPTRFVETYRSLVETQVAHIMARICENAEIYHADREGMSKAKTTLNAWTRLWRSKAASGPTMKDLHDQCGDFLGWFWCVTTDVRLAIGLDRDKACLTLVDLLDEAHAAGAPATESRRLQ